MRKQRQEEYAGFRMPGIRLSEKITPNVEEHASEKYTAKLYAIHRFDKAHLVMLIEEELIPREDGIAMLKALREMESEGVEKVRLEVQGGSHSGEQYLIRKLSEEVGGRIHLGRSSGDFSAVSNNIYWRDQLLDLIDRINQYRAVLIETGMQHLETVMLGYTHGQAAQPTTYGHQLLAWSLNLGRDVARMRAIFERVNMSPAGAGILTGTNFPLNRHRTSDLLGFDGPAINTFDTILQRDLEIEVASVIAIHGYAMGRQADDIMMWSTSEFGIIDVPDRFCGTSSIMMQKKNPQATQDIKGSAADAVGGLMTTFMVEKGPTGMPMLDRRYAGMAITRGFDHAGRNLKWMIEMVPALEVKKDLMRERAGAFWAQATDIAGALVSEKGMPWRTAHQIVGILIRYSDERGFAPKDTTVELLDEAAIEYMGEPVNLSAEALEAALDPEHFIRSRTLFGGPGPDEVRRRLPEYEAGLQSDIDWLTRVREAQQASSDSLESAIDALVNAG